MIRFLTSKFVAVPAAVLSILLLVALSAVLVTKNNRIDDLEKDLKDVRNDYALAKANNATLEGGLSQCNQSIKEAERVANVVAEAGVRAVAEASEGREGVERQLDRIDGVVSALGDQARCEDAIELLRGGASQ